MPKPLPVDSTIPCDTVTGFDHELKQAIMCAKPAVLIHKGFHLCSEHWDTMRSESTTTTGSRHGHVS